MYNMTMPKWRYVYDWVVSRIDGGEFVPDGRIPSEEELALLLGVSRQTVHKAVQELSREGVVYRKRRWGTFVANRSGTGSLVPVIFDYAADYPQAELLRGVQAGLGEEFQVVLVDAAGNPETEIARLSQLRTEIAGILAYPICDAVDSGYFGELAESERQGKGVPLVFMDRSPVGVEHYRVSSDNRAATRKAVLALAEEGKRVAFFSGDNRRTSSVADRHAGYRDACEESGGYDLRLERWFPKSMESEPDRLKVAICDAMKSLAADGVSAVFCTQDLYAALVFEAMEQDPQLLGGWSVGAYHDWPLIMFPRAAQMIRVVQQKTEIGRQAALMLRRKVAGEAAADVTVELESEVLVPDKFSVQARN